MLKYLNIIVTISLLQLSLISTVQSEQIILHINQELGANYAGFIVADSLGYYADYGIEIEFCSSDESNECLRDSAITLSVINLQKAIEYADKGADIVNICQINQTSSLAFISLKHKNIDSLHNLSNQSIAVIRGMYNNSSNLNKLLKIKANILETHATKELMIYDGVDAIIGSMEREYIDLYFAGFDPEELNIIRLNDLGLDIVEEGIYAPDSLIKSRSELLRQFVNASAQGWIYAKNNTNQTAELIAQYLKKHRMRANYEILDEELKHILSNIFPVAKKHKAFSLDKKDFDKVIEILLKSKIISQKINFNKFYKPQILEDEQNK